ncbi:response regulator transcription factor [Chitinophaga rhizosphaerae]|uniref:response regulator transcription factor n=1 Tax=Chitinophaga rhizosphaerae TaxID=1864947 RepID=UPI001F0CB5D4|nr:response regulator transcription factor [Chitinophaga rhizosphaerae]
MSLQCLIVDDEPLAHDVILQYARDVPDLEIVGQCYLATEALAFLNRRPVDLIFLDIRMPRLSGLDFLRTLQHRPLVIITSAFEEHALEGYELEVCDYLLKPFRFDRFLKAVNRAQSIFRLWAEGENQQRAQQGQRSHPPTLPPVGQAPPSPDSTGAPGTSCSPPPDAPIHPGLRHSSQHPQPGANEPLGSPGSTGAPGSQGTSGSPGPRGTSWTPGASGISRTAGTSGTPHDPLSIPSQASSTGPSGGFEDISRLFVKSDRKWVQVELEQVQYLESLGNYVKIWEAERFILTPRTLSSFGEQLPSETFIRIHKSFILNRKFVRLIEGNVIQLKSGKQLPLGKNYRHVVKLLLQ